MARNSHRHTKLVNYGRKRSSRSFAFRLWYIIPIAALLGFIAAVILGNTLGEMVGETETLPPEAPAETSRPEVETVGTKQVNAVHVTLEGINDNTAFEVGRQIPDGADAVSMTLFDRAGTPYYHSDVATSFGKPCGELTLKNVFKPVKGGDLYASVIFPSTLLSVSDPNRNAVTAAYEATLIKELRLAGADEVVVCFAQPGTDGEPLSAEALKTVSEYIAAVRLQSEGLRIGVALSVKDVKTYAGTAALEELNRLADFCSVDLTAYGSVEKLTEDLLPLQVEVLRYEMRLMLSSRGKTEEYLTGEKALLEKLGMKSLQYAG